MVLELLINPKKAAGKPHEMIFLGFVYAFVSVILSLIIFESHVSIVMITLTIIASIPLVRYIIDSQEKKDLTLRKEKKLLIEHGKAISSLMYLFIGFTIAFLSVYIFFPVESIEQIFSVQLDTILSVTSTPTGNYISFFDDFSRIFLNNLKILFFCVAFSFFYGAGAIFILAWNSSVMATAIGSFIRINVLNTTTLFEYFKISFIGIMQYAIHGIPEIFAYFVGALASGIISFAMVKHQFKDENFKIMMRDASELLIISVFILLIAGLIEVYVTPLLF